MFRSLLALTLFTLIGSAPTPAADSAEFAATLAAQYRVLPNIVYETANGYENRLDLYLPPVPDAGLHARRRLGGRHEGSDRAPAPALPRARLRDCQRGVPAGAPFAGPGGDRRLPLRATLGLRERRRVRV